MNAEDKPLANQLVVLREEFDDWAVLFNPENGAAMGTNPVGVAIWKMLDGHRTVSQISRDLPQQFAEVPANSLEEVVTFVSSLEREGFVGRVVE